jgi:hypothetical protein
MNGIHASERQPDRVLLIGCSRGWGLTYYNTVLAVAMTRAGVRENDEPDKTKIYLLETLFRQEAFF